MNNWPIKQFIEEAEPFTFDATKICPEPKNIFRVFKETKPADIRVVIVSQDPYPQKYVDTGQHVATGRAFAVNEGMKLQPSLRVIMDELATHYYMDPMLEDDHLDVTLQTWQDQGILLLNSSLTCELFKPEGAESLMIPGTHSYYWHINVMEKLFKWMNEEMGGIIFVFLGKKAQYYNKFISPVRHYIINEHHPAADVHTGTNMFRGSRVFNQINKILTDNNGPEFAIKFLEHTN